MVHPPTPNDLVYIILLNWGQWELTLACLASLSKLRYSNYRVLVVENGSTNDSAARIQEWIDRQGAATAAGRPAVFTMVRSPTNLGFARGNNLGIAEALRKNADYVWLLNNDTECDEHALSALITCSVRNDAAIVSSNVLLMADPSRSWYQGGWFNPLVATAHHTSFETFERLKDRRFLTGCSLFMPASVIRRVGLLDERFFAYFEDVDYCIRAEAQRVPLRVTLESKVLHHASGTSGLRSEFSYRTNTESAVVFTAKHYPWYLPSVIGHRVARSLALLLLGRFTSARAVLHGILRGILRGFMWRNLVTAVLMACAHTIL